MNWNRFWDIVLMAIVGSAVLGLVIENIGAAVSTVVDCFRRDRRDDDEE